MSEIGAREYIDFLQSTRDFEAFDSARHSANSNSGYQRWKQECLRQCDGMSHLEILVADKAILVGRITKAIANLKLEIPKAPEVALLPMGDFNARALLAPNGEPICVLDSNLCANIVYFAWALAEATTRSPDCELKRDMAKCCLSTTAVCDEVVNRGSESARKYLNSVELGADESWFLFGGHLAQAIQLFMLSHEFAHHIKGHLGNIHNEVLQRQGKTLVIKAYNRKQLDEFEADLLGAEIFLATEFLQNRQHSLCAPLVFFDLLSFASEVSMNKTVSSTHPPSRDRRIRLETFMWDKLPADAREFYEATKSFWPAAVRLNEILAQS